MSRSNYFLIISALVLLVSFSFLNSSSLFKTIFIKIGVAGNYGEIKSSDGTEENVIEKEKLKTQINFVGDVMLGRHVEYLMSQHGSDYPYRFIDFLDPENSYTVGNFEASIPINHVKTPNFNFNFSVNPWYLGELNKAGFTHLSLANNHAFDYGFEGFKNAKVQLERNNLLAFGQPNELSTSSITFINLPKHRIAIIGIHSVFSLPNDKDMKMILEHAENNSDFQVVFIHWGEEYQHQQSKTQRQLATKFSELGTDLIVGHHPHVVQGLEKINNTLVFYSLGNFIFDQYFSQDVRQGLTLRLFENSDSELSLDLIPVTSEETLAQPAAIVGDEKNIFLNKLAQYSSDEIQEDIRLAKINLRNMLATSTETAIIAE